jgi:hypothetical protein
MARGRKERPAEEHTFLAVLVDEYEAKVDSSLNYHLRDPRSGLFREEEPPYEFVTSLHFNGVATYPEDRVGEEYRVTVRGEELRQGDFSLTLKDMQARDEYGAPKYRSYRGREIPVFEPPPGLATLEKPTKNRPGSAWFWVAPRVVSDYLSLLALPGPFYLSLHEHKVQRKRWVLSLGLQTTDPAEE